MILFWKLKHTIEVKEKMCDLCDERQKLAGGESDDRVSLSINQVCKLIQLELDTSKRLWRVYQKDGVLFIVYEDSKKQEMIELRNTE